MSQTKKKSFIQKNGLIAVWSMAGFMAMGYIGFLATGTENQRSNSGLIANNNAPASGRADISPVRQEVAELRAHVKELKNREAKLAKKLSTIEQSLGPLTAALPDEAPAVAGVGAQAPIANAAMAAANSNNNASINILPLTQDDKITEFSDQGQPDAYGIDLASARSVDSLKRHWDYLKSANAGILGGLTPHFIDKGSNDLPLYSLIAGPFDKMSDARSSCEMLSKGNIDCQETQFQVAPMEKLHTAGRTVTK